MSLSNAPAAYTDCYKLYELAVSMPGGVRSPFPSREAATYFQMRMNHARTLQRNESRRIYAPDSPLYNTSEFDSYKVQVLEDSTGEWWVYIRPHGNWEAIISAEPIPVEEQQLLSPVHSHRPQIESQPATALDTDL